jgi:hypothetical protein
MTTKLDKPTSLTAFEISGADIKRKVRVACFPSQFNHMISKDVFEVTECDRESGHENA